MPGGPTSEGRNRGLQEPPQRARRPGEPPGFTGGELAPGADRDDATARAFAQGVDQQGRAGLRTVPHARPSPAPGRRRRRRRSGPRRPGRSATGFSISRAQPAVAAASALSACAASGVAITRASSAASASAMFRSVQAGTPNLPASCWARPASVSTRAASSASGRSARMRACQLPIAPQPTTPIRTGGRVIRSAPGPLIRDQHRPHRRVEVCAARGPASPGSPPPPPPPPPWCPSRVRRRACPSRATTLPRTRVITGAGPGPACPRKGSSCRDYAAFPPPGGLPGPCRRSRCRRLSRERARPCGRTGRRRGWRGAGRRTYCSSVSRPR